MSVMQVEFQRRARRFIQVTELCVGEVDLHIHWQVILMLYLFFFLSRSGRFNHTIQLS